MPLVVIGPPVRPVPVATFVTVPLGSSPEGTKVHFSPLEINTSPTLAV